MALSTDTDGTTNTGCFFVTHPVPNNFEPLSLKTGEGEVLELFAQEYPWIKIFQ